jgi:hypothetical protein
MVGITLRLALIFCVLCTLPVITTLIIGALLPGGNIAAFTSNPFRTVDIYVLDLDRFLSDHIMVRGHEDEVPVWSAELRWFRFVPRP